RLSGRRAQQRGTELGRDERELVRRDTRRRHVAGCQDDLDVRTEYPRPRARVSGLVAHAADGRQGRVDLTLGEPQLRQPGLRVAAQLVGPAVRLLGPPELAAQSVELGAQVA